MNLEKIKMHLRVTHSFEDELIQEYMEWAENDVIASVSLSPDVDKEYLKGNMQYKKAVVMLTSFYFENRLTITDKKHTELPYGVLDSIQKLRRSEERRVGKECRSGEEVAVGGKHRRE